MKVDNQLHRSIIKICAKLNNYKRDVGTIKIKGRKLSRIIADSSNGTVDFYTEFKDNEAGITVNTLALSFKVGGDSSEDLVQFMELIEMNLYFYQQIDFPEWIYDDL